MLALAMYEDAPEARELLSRAEASVAPYFETLDRTSGAWPEGIGYWNYGMRYGFLYLLSHERATGREHALMRLQGVRQTLAFPLDFCPHGQPCSFGDVNRWEPLPFHYQAAMRLDCHDVLQGLDAYLAEHGAPLWGLWPNAVEWLALHPGEVAGREQEAEEQAVVKLYKGLDWGVLVDRSSDPQLYMSVRGGTTKVPHGHRDLLSYHCVVGREKLIANLGPAEYLDTTFSPRRDEMFEMAPASKNTILVNGVGVAAQSSLECTELVHLDGAQGIRLEATSAMGEMYDGPAARFCGRWVMLLQEGAFLILDRVILPHVGRVESRLHTYARVEAGQGGALLQGEQECLRVAYACNVPALFCTATTAPTTPSESSATALRWCTERQHEDVVMATLLSPGTEETQVSLVEGAAGYDIAVSGSDWRKTLTVSTGGTGTPRLSVQHPS
jgi:hypothetical protein